MYRVDHDEAAITPGRELKCLQSQLLAKFSHSLQIVPNRKSPPVVPPPHSGDNGRMNVNFAERAHNHNWKLDPIVRSLLDTDFYKLLMLQFIWKNFPAVRVTTEVVNRTARVRLAGEVDAPALIAQMEHLRGLRFRRSELIWLAGNTFYGTRHIFEPAFLAWLETDFRLSDYTVAEQDGQLILRFSGLWTEVTMWEVYALALVSESRTRAALARLNEMELDVL